MKARPTIREKILLGNPESSLELQVDSLAQNHLEAIDSVVGEEKDDAISGI